MTPVMPTSTIYTSLTPGCSFGTRKNPSLRRYYNLRKPIKRILYAQDLILPLSTSFRSFPSIRLYGLRQRPCSGRVAASGVDLDVEAEVNQVDESVSADLDQESGQTSETPLSVDTSNGEESSVKSKPRSRLVRKSDMPPVKNEDLVPGATFKGKVRSIKPFGAFVDIGAFAEGLVHISRLSEGFVNNVADVVSIGQEVEVKLVDANFETKRISLTMRESEPTTDGDESRSPRKAQTSDRPTDAERKTTKFAVGEILEGVVSELTDSGAQISLSEEEEGFLPFSQIDDEIDEDAKGKVQSKSLEVGQEVVVQVLRVVRGQPTLTMRIKGVVDDSESADIEDYDCPGSEYTADNPFLVAFYRNEDISAFLDEREMAQDAAEMLEESSSFLSLVEDNIAEPATEETSNITSSNEQVVTPVIQEIKIEELPEDRKVETTAEIFSSEAQIQASGETEISSLKLDESEKAQPVPEVSSSITSEEEVQIPVEGSQTPPPIQGEIEPVQEIANGVEVGKVEAITESIPSELTSGVTSSSEYVDAPVIQESRIEETQTTESEENQLEEVTSKAEVEDSVAEPATEETSDITSSNEQVVTPVIQEVEIEELPEDQKVETAAETFSSEAQIQASGETETSSLKLDESEKAQPGPEVSSSITSEKEVQIPVEESQTPLPIQNEIEPVQEIANEVGVGKVEAVTESISSELTSGVPSSSEQVDAPVIQESTIEEMQTIESVENQIEEVTPKAEVDAEILPATPVEDETVGATAEQNGSAASPSETTATANISPALVKQLREETGAGMMDCKKALAATEGDIIKAQEYLRKKGLASADKKASRKTAEGRIGSYVHDSRIGVLIEVNCETDFVSRGDIFKELVNDLAMQVAACPQVEYLVPEDVPKEIVEKDREIEMQREDILSKPEQIRSKIVEGRIKKRLEELALLEQPYIKDDKVVVKDFVKSTIATIGENIKVKRFARFVLGEGLEKRSQDFAAEVAAQTSAKPVSAPAKEQQPAATETTETTEEPPKAAISAALVKQLREETGAGMMDCKKALSETAGDLQKAQEYLRKKGLSTADKKSGRLAAEGRIGSYIHDSRIGVLIEVNCETDFVGRSEKFKELVDDLAMQVVACPKVEYVSIEDIPGDIVSKEKEIEMQREDILSKPENIREKIVEGRVSKRLGEIALLEQPFIKDDNILVKDLVKQAVAAIGENIKVRRFVRFTLGESSESKSEETES